MKITGRHVYLATYDNPGLILLRKGKVFHYEEKIHLINEKEIREAEFDLQKDDMLILMSDGVTNAGMGKTTDGGWGYEEVEKFCEQKYKPNLSAQRMAVDIAEACVDLNLNETDDDITVLTIRLCEPLVTNLMIGPPSKMEKDEDFLRVFFEEEGQHIVCGGTTAKFVANYLGEEVVTIKGSETDAVPAMSVLKGVDMVTEGYLTLKQLVTYSNRWLSDSMAVISISKQKDAAAKLAVELFERSSEINIFFGNARNPAYKELNIDSSEKLRLTYKLKEHLERAGKKVRMNIW